MTDKNNRDGLSAEDRKLWQQVTENISKMDNDQAARPLVRKAAYMGDNLASHNAPQRLTPVINLTESNFSLAHTDPHWQQKLQRGKVRPEGKIDLHGMSEDRAFTALVHYLQEAHSRGRRLILVITGKGRPKEAIGHMSSSDYERGKGILQNNVPRWLSLDPLASLVLSYHSAHARDGGAGALYVVLKRMRRK